MVGADILFLWEENIKEIGFQSSGPCSETMFEVPEPLTLWHNWGLGIQPKIFNDKYWFWELVA